MTSVSQIVEKFSIQATIDATIAAGHYLAVQPTGELIVPATRKVWSSGRGFGIVNEAASQAPVAIRFHGALDSTPFVLRPGEAVYPGQFDSFDYGLPFGWAGGGVVMLKVAQSRDVRFEIPSARPEVIYWRTALIVEADASPLPTLKRNWPAKFPWEYALGASGANQNGAPAIHVEPTRTLLFLPAAGVAAGIVPGTTYNARLFFRSPADEAGLGNYMADVSWVAPAGGLIVPGVVTELPASLDRLDLNLGGVTITSPDGTLAVADWCVAVRYGRI